ncbi:3-hydroxyisobutyrate dehydrogenase-like beta-hydroxyacid dehydrogenase [Rhodopseudomonas julia]|uniref:3-hydroxyisobutyrate dehydrogenase-like beta-hydroxyacid dehydrogenase n=1 Tax=Rhodopseudomonas julia TaxID=200617 RepID=A0ABU0C554_9BRAD|nr:NAD(P)-dependent oxidoreductase [Rhodopseudomonas julia]MDQ0325650.1 3-hydroxyisobutyrate dehydrogenase-like beta-hydroxyacid dehydrogenase [Rhodopseudomonas julia]
MKIGFIGLGQMGTGMAKNLIAAGHQVKLYNRTRSKAEALAGDGATVAETIADACSGEAVFTMLPDDRALAGIVDGPDGILENLPKGALHISSSTISVAMAERLAAAHSEKGQAFLAAPVFGRPEMAAAGKLFVVAGGAEAAIETAKPLFDAIGQRTFAISEEPKGASLVKLSGNFLIASVIESLGEAIALVDKGGIDKKAYLELLTSTIFGAPVYKTYGGLIVEENFEPAGFPAPLGKKDVDLAMQAGDALNVPLPIASLLHDRFLRLLAHGGENLDWSAMGALAAKDAGKRD